MRIAVDVVGVGKVGRGLAAALRQARARVTIVSAKALVAGESKRPLHGDLVVIAARDGAIPEVAKAILSQRLLSRDAVVVHCAGALDTQPLAELRGACAGVAQMHPMISFADPSRPPNLRGGHVHVQGDSEAVRRARVLCRAIGLTPRTFDDLDLVAYHAAAGLVANGAAALAAAGAQLLAKAGARASDIPAMLGPLLRSVADNVEHLGLPGALTGPVRRGDARAVGKHLETLFAKAPELAPLYLSCAMAQLPMARALGDARALAFDEVEHVLVEGLNKSK